MTVATAEIGGTNARGMYFTEWDNPESRGEPVKIRVGEDPTYTDTRDALMQAIEGAAGNRPDLLVVTVAGVLNADRTMITAAGNIHACVNKPLKADLNQHFGCPVLLCNDAEALGHAEARYGRGQGRTFGARVWGSGFGGCHVEANEGGTYRVVAQEPGHVVIQIQDTGMTCGCRKLNHLEAFVGGKSTERHYNVPSMDMSPEQWELTERALAAGEASLHTVNLEEEFVIYGGSIGINEADRLHRVRDIANQEFAMVPVPELLPSQFGHEAGLIGGLAFAPMSSLY